MRNLDVDGIPVSTRSVPSELPEVASLIEFTTTIIDSGDGPELCLGGVAESRPPQCSGPVADNLVMSENWAETLSGVSWGERTVVVRWPPVDGHVELVSDEPTKPRPPTDRSPPQIPDECTAITEFVGEDALHEWATANPDRAGIGFVFPTPSGQQLGYQVVGDLDAARAELRDGDRQPCLVQVQFTQADLSDAQREMHENAEQGLWLTASASGNMTNRITASVAVADLRTVGGVAALLDDPAMLTISGSGVILE
ncbi:MAG: hypothetical protein ACR2P0_10100 [Acidimicrobiales bacterium]